MTKNPCKTENDIKISTTKGNEQINLALKQWFIKSVCRQNVINTCVGYQRVLLFEKTPYLRCD